jgi:hypothetical protein
VAHVWASGLTTIYGCTFDREGNFWATEMFQPNKAGPPGDLVRIPFEGPAAVQHIGGGSVAADSRLRVLRGRLRRAAHFAADQLATPALPAGSSGGSGSAG